MAGCIMQLYDVFSAVITASNSLTAANCWLEKTKSGSTLLILQAPRWWCYQSMPTRTNVPGVSHQMHVHHPQLVLSPQEARFHHLVAVGIDSSVVIRYGEHCSCIKQK